MTSVPEIAPEDQHHDLSPEVLQELRRRWAESQRPGARWTPMDEVFSGLGIDLEELRSSARLPSDG